MTSTFRDRATNTSPVRTAALPPTMTKKSCHWSVMPHPAPRGARSCASSRCGSLLGRSVDDRASFVVADAGRAIAPALQGFRCEPGPVRDLAHDPQRIPTSIRPRRVAGELLVGDVGIVLER